MNKKQLIVAWVMGILISYFFSANASSRIGNFIESLMLSIPICIIGGLLIYTLKDKKK